MDVPLSIPLENNIEAVYSKVQFTQLLDTTKVTE